MSKVTTEQWIDQVLGEHRELRRMLAELRTFLERPRPDIGEKGFHTWAADLSGRLVKLHDKLFRHFRLEDEAGMVDEISRNHPEVAGKIEEVVGEHPKILTELREIMSATLAYSEGQEPEDPALRRRLGALLDRLDEHERAETELIQTTEYQDLGAAD